jgi:uncharacterized protein with HEPN domain
MNLKRSKYLFDIQSAIDRIYIHIKEVKNIKDYSANVTVKSAVEREFEIIGEAMKNLLDIEPNIEITNPQKIVALRNRIIHGYDTIDDILIYQVFQDHVPLLKKEVDKLLDSE